MEFAAASEYFRSLHLANLLLRGGLLAGVQYLYDTPLVCILSFVIAFRAFGILVICVRCGSLFGVSGGSIVSVSRRIPVGYVRNCIVG